VGRLYNILRARKAAFDNNDGVHVPMVGSADTVTVEKAA